MSTFIYYERYIYKNYEHKSQNYCKWYILYELTFHTYYIVSKILWIEIMLNYTLDKNISHFFLAHKTCLIKDLRNDNNFSVTAASSSRSLTNFSNFFPVCIEILIIYVSNGNGQKFSFVNTNISQP